MISEWMTKLLILQDRDMTLRQIEEQLDLIPRERDETKGRIATIEAEIEANKARVKELEVKGKGLEAEMAEIESQIVKYKNQQLQVKKNEEYQALAHEIENGQGKISDLEEKEIEVLYSLDEAREAQKTDEVESRGKIATEQSFLKRLDEKEANLKGELDGARAAFEGAESQVEKRYLSVYKRVRLGLRFPIVVPVTGQKCGGCHMKVSAALDFDARSGSEISTCDNCHRIVYIDA